jgi:hypothetical protein
MRASTSSGQSRGSPKGVMPPYSIEVIAMASSIGAKETLRASRCRRTTLLTSTRVVASAMQAAYLVSPPRLAATTTQLADCSSETP